MLGNAGFVQIIDLGSNIKDLIVGECYIYFCNSLWDEHGYPIKIAGYDCKNTIMIKCVSIPQVDAPIVPNTYTNSTRDLSVKQKRWISLIKVGYGQRIVPIVFDISLIIKPLNLS